MAIVPSSAFAADPKGVDFFEKKIRPVLIEHCYACHSAEAKKSKGDLVVDTRAGLLMGGETGPAVVPNDPVKSILMKAIRHEGPKMPNAQKKLSDEIIADFETWIKLGAPDPRDGKAVVKKGIDYDEGRKHWAYQPVKISPAPSVKNGNWTKSDLDKYVLAAIEAKGMTPSADAAPHTLIRRMSFAITGLPPTPDEVKAFEKAYAANPDTAMSELADRLLASAQYGEYWARHWMDGVRFDQGAQSIGYYREWLIRSFNSGQAYDQFIIWQLAGDLLPLSGNEKLDDDKRIAAQMHVLNLGEMDRIEGMIEVTAQQFLGVSINCAKCHDHKFDAYTQEDYYALAGIFTSTGFTGSYKADAPPLELKTYPNSKISTVVDSTKGIGDTKLLIRGERNQPGAVVPRRFPIVLAGDKQTPIGQLTKGSGRLELAQWVASSSNPLTARVMANRVWTWVTGQPIVGSTSDFGAMGDKPINPELLDYLADRFVKSGWSIQSLIKDIVTSRTFRQSSRPGAELVKADPENKLLARMPVRRLDAEQLTDSLYYIADGLLTTYPDPNDRVNGTFGALKTRNAGKDDIKAYRSTFGIGLIPAKMFDCADPDLITTRRDESVTAPQLLFFLNNPTLHRIGSIVAKKADTMAGEGADGPAKIKAAYQIVLSREPSAAELAEADAFVKKHGIDRFGHLLLCTSEFSYVE